MALLAARRRGERGARAGRLFLLAVLGVFLLPAAGRTATYSIAGFSDTPVVIGVSQPTAFTWTPDGRMLVLEKIGRVRIVVGGVLQATPALDISALVDSGSEKGLLGICLHPGFTSNGYVYLYYTDRVPQNRISRFTMSGNTLDPASETVILDHIDATNGNHNGGELAIGPDGKLWAAPGDSGTGGAKSQDLSVGSFNGKVLRMELDGSPAAGNPFLGDPTREGRIWAYGFRNPWRFIFRPSNGSLYVADVGQSAREEIDVVTAGGNYGWPMAEGTLGGCPGCIPPVFEYDHTVGQAIIGGVFVTGGLYPQFLRGKYVFGDYVSSWIRYLEFSPNDTVVGPLQDFATSAEGPVRFAMGPDQAIYYAAINTGKIYRINPPPANYFTLTPCRQYDSRDATPLPDNTNRIVTVIGAPCGVPPGATVVTANITVFGITGAGGNAVFQVGTDLDPTPAWINYPPGETQRGNAGFLPLNGSGQIVVKVNQGGGRVDFTVDVNGYFQ